jgi:transcriptional regulator with XRE-family HTH domain
VKQLREEAGLTLEKLAYESELGSKGYLSDIENGLARPTIKTLKVIADHLDIALMDLVCFPDEDERQALVDELRSATTAEIQRLRKALRERR